MTGQINVNKIAARTGNTITVNSGDKISGAAGSIVAPGQVIQTTQQVYTTQTNITATSFTSTGLTTSITPTSTSSKILALVHLSVEVYQNASSGYSVVYEIKRDSTQIAKKYTNCYAGVAGNAYYVIPMDGTMIFLDSPNTTSSTTYSVNAYLTSSANSFTMRLNNQTGTSSLTLQEIAQ